MRNVRQQLIQVELVGAPGDALQDYATRPVQAAHDLRVRLLEEGRGADHVDDAVYRHHELVVFDRILGEELQDRDRFVDTPVAFEHVGQQ